MGPDDVGSAALCDWSGAEVPLSRLHPQEVAALGPLPAWRRREGAGARLLLAELLVASGWSGHALRRPDGSPYVVVEGDTSGGIDPPEVSLSHAGELSAAVVAPPGCAVGIDVTAVEESNAVLLPRLLRIASGCTAGDMTRGARASVLVSLAEASYKALRPARGGLAAVEVDWDGSATSALVRLRDRPCRTLQAAVLLHDGHVVSLVTAGTATGPVRVVAATDMLDGDGRGRGRLPRRPGLDPPA